MPTTILILSLKWETVRRQRHSLQSSLQKSGLSWNLPPKTPACPVGLQYPPRPLVRPDEQFTAAYNKICQKAEQDLLQLLIQQQQMNSSTDAEAISSLKQQLNQMFPDQTKREKAEKRIQSATNRSLTRMNLSQTRPTENRKKKPKEKNKLRHERAAEIEPSI